MSFHCGSRGVCFDCMSIRQTNYGNTDCWIWATTTFGTDGVIEPIHSPKECDILEGLGRSPRGNLGAARVSKTRLFLAYPP